MNAAGAVFDKVRTILAGSVRVSIGTGGGTTTAGSCLTFDGFGFGAGASFRIGLSPRTKFNSRPSLIGFTGSCHRLR
jgi:hypothetical protein